MDTALTILNAVKSTKSAVDAAYWVYSICDKIKRKINKRKISRSVPSKSKSKSKSTSKQKKDSEVDDDETWETF